MDSSDVLGDTMDVLASHPDPSSQAGSPKRRRLIGKRSSVIGSPQSTPKEEANEELNDMLLQLITDAPPRALPLPDADTLDSGDIISDVQEYERRILAALDDQALDPYLLRVLQCAVASLEWRLCDIGLLEKVYVLHASEGGVALRAHTSAAHAYHPRKDVWEKLVDTVPQGTLRRVKNFLHTVEGFFRRLHVDTPRDEHSILAFAKSTVDGKSTDQIRILLHT